MPSVHKYGRHFSYKQGPSLLRLLFLSFSLRRSYSSAICHLNRIWCRFLRQDQSFQICGRGQNLNCLFKLCGNGKVSFCWSCNVVQLWCLRIHRRHSYKLRKLDIITVFIYSEWSRAHYRSEPSFIIIIKNSTVRCLMAWVNGAAVALYDKSTILNKIIHNFYYFFKFQCWYL